MSSYRFCRSDDIALLVDALRRCWWPHVPHDPEPTSVSFKREIRDLQVWCSSCMVAFDGADPVAVLIGAKRLHETLVHRLAVHPEHLRRGHARHLVTSLVSKLAILGPPRIVAEVPEALSGMRALLLSCGFVEEAVLTDYVLDVEVPSADDVATTAVRSQGGSELLSIPVTVEDLEANGLVADGARTGWQRSPETLRARRAELRGLALVADDRIRAYALWRPEVDSGPQGGTEIAALRVTDATDDAPALLAVLLERLRPCCAAPLWMPRVHPDEHASSWLAAQKFTGRGRTILNARIASPA
jgi:GNAT superfamily N-acetyltransferase